MWIQCYMLHFVFSAGGPFTLFVRPGGEVPLRGSNITFICQMSQENPFSYPFWTDSNRIQIPLYGKLASTSSSEMSELHLLLTYFQNSGYAYSVRKYWYPYQLTSENSNKKV